VTTFKRKSEVKKILLSFDVEEFDIPEEYGDVVSEEEKISVTAAGLEKLLPLLDRLNIKATFFMTAHFATLQETLAKRIAEKHEVASHTFYHSSFQLSHLKQSRETLEQITGTKVVGFRMPRLQHINKSDLIAAGYLYDSSLNPTFIPGRYNKFFSKRTIHKSENIIVIPSSVTPLIRFPLFWLSFKNFSLSLIKFFTSLTLSADDYVCLYFHPWEFVDISKYKVPAYVKRMDGDELLNRFEKYLCWLKTKGEFSTMSEYINHSPPIR